MRKYQKVARKYFIEKFNLNVDSPYIDVAKKVLENSNGKLLFEDYTKHGAAEFLDRAKYKYEAR